jgi:hypothetical protein
VIRQGEEGAAHSPAARRPRSPGVLGQITAEGRREDFEGDLHAQVREWLGITF